MIVDCDNFIDSHPDSKLKYQTSSFVDLLEILDGMPVAITQALTIDSVPVVFDVKMELPESKKVETLEKD